MILRMLIIAVSILVLSCASVQRVNDAQPIQQSDCNVKVYSSLNAAESNGVLEELCIISGTSSGSFSHTVATAINKHKDKACECGADNVYIQTQDAGTLGTASVTMVGFSYKKQQKESDHPLSNTEVFNRAKKCQEKGGVWVNGICQINLE